MAKAPKNSITSYIWVLISLHLALALPLAYLLNVWADEASTLYTTQNGFYSALLNAADYEKQAPLYFWIMGAWRSIDASVFFARLFSVICTSAAIYFFASLARRIFSPKSALVVTGFFALHPFLVWASVEIRVYSLVILMSVLLIRLFYEVFFSDEKQAARRGQVLFLVVSIISLYINYYLGFLLVGLFAGLLFTDRRREYLRYLIIMALTAIAFSPLVVVLRYQFLANTNGYVGDRTVFQGLRTLWHHFCSFVLPSEVFPGNEPSVADLIRLWAIRIVSVAAIAASALNCRRLSLRTLVTGAISASIFACLLIAYFLLGDSYVEVRHASVVFVPLILFVASLIDDLIGNVTGTVARTAAAAMAMLVVASFSYALVTLYPNLAKRGDWARIGQFIEQNETPGQPIIVFPTFDALALPYQYHGPNQISPNERFFDFPPEAADGSPDSLRKETDFIIAQIPSASEYVWLAVNERCLTTEACQPLENYIEANYTIEKEQEFYLEKLFLLRKKVK